VTAESFERSPLAHRVADLASLEKTQSTHVLAAEVPDLVQVDLRANAELTRRLSIPFPSRPNTYATGTSVDVLWLGPDEWLLAGPAEASRDLLVDLAQALAGEHHSLVDVSAARAVLELSGPGVLGLLSKGCGLDLHPRSWHAGDCAQTLLARVPVILQQRDDATRIFVRPSLGDYLVDWLLDAGAD
jgi:sarcosine oxidase subunit gamma